MTVVETLLVLAGIPLAVYGLITVLALWPKFTRPRYRPGQDWDYPPVLWVANPSGVSEAPSEDLETDATPETRSSTARGGARGNW